MKFFEKFLQFLTDNIPKTSIPIWVAIVAFAVIVILIAIIIGVSTSKSKKSKDKKRTNTAEPSNDAEQLADTAEVSMQAAETVAYEAPTEHIINIERTIQTDIAEETVITPTAPIETEHIDIKPLPIVESFSVRAADSRIAPAVVAAPSADECEEFEETPLVKTATVAPVTKTYATPVAAPIKESRPVAASKSEIATAEEDANKNDKKITVMRSVVAPNSPIAKPVFDDGKTVYTKGVSGKSLPPTSIAKPLVNHANENDSEKEKINIAQPVKPAIAQPIKAAAPKAEPKDDIMDKSHQQPTIKATPLKSTVVKSAAPATTPKATASTTAKAKPTATKAAATALKADAKPTKIVKSIGEDSDVATFGKYVITVNKANIMRPYKFELRANNGQLLFESEPYKVKPRLTSINAFKGYTKEGSFIIDEDKQGYFRFKLYNAKGELAGVGESYKSRAACESSIESTKRFAESATVIEDSTN